VYYSSDSDASPYKADQSLSCISDEGDFGLLTPASARSQFMLPTKYKGRDAEIGLVEGVQHRHQADVEPMDEDVPSQFTTSPMNHDAAGEPVTRDSSKISLVGRVHATQGSGRPDGESEGSVLPHSTRQNRKLVTIRSLPIKIVGKIVRDKSVRVFDLFGVAEVRVDYH
jgi:hypothetical protein